MTIKLLWPGQRWQDKNEVEIEAAGAGVECIFGEGPETVTDAQWGDCDAIISGPDPLSEQNMAKIPKCKIFVTPKVGFDNLDIKKYGKWGIPVCNVPDYGTQDVADHAMALLLDLMKGIQRYDTALRQNPRGNWRATRQPLALRLSQARMGIVGLGRIGTAMTLRCKAFGMDVSFFDPYKSNGSDLALGIRRADSLAALLESSDIVSIHVPLTEETHNLIDAAVLAHAKPGLVLINAARGEVVDIDALYDAMKVGRVGGAGLDVLPEEPANEDRPLIRAWLKGEEGIADRVIITPHAAFYTPQSLFDMRTLGIKVALKYLRTGRLENCVNHDYLENSRSVALPDN